MGGGFGTLAVELVSLNESMLCISTLSLLLLLLAVVVLVAGKVFFKLFVLVRLVVLTAGLRLVATGFARFSSFCKIGRGFDFFGSQES